MKKILLLLLTVFLTSVVYCQSESEIEKEKEKIKAVIENETNNYRNRDFVNQSQSFLQSEDLIILYASKEGYGYLEGWDEISTGYKNLYENSPDPIINPYEFTNYKINVFDNCAWAVYDQIEKDPEGNFVSKHISVRFLEKVDGEWKIAYLSFVDTTPYDNEAERSTAEGEE